MIERNVDVAIIGAGSAGLAAYRAAREWTTSVVLIEAGQYGTTCARVGCMPSKLLIAAAEAAHAIDEASQFGVGTAGSAVDGKAVMERVQSERDRFVGFVLESVNDIPAEHRIRGMARFLDDHRLLIDDKMTLTAERIVIATGSSPSYPAFFAALGDRLLVNDDIFDWQDLPGSVAVFGPGVIGLELGQALHRLGVNVLMFGLDNLVGPLTDPRVRDAAREAFTEEFYLDADATVRSMQRHGNGVVIDYVDLNGEPASVSVDYVIAGVSRTPACRSTSEACRCRTSGLCASPKATCLSPAMPRMKSHCSMRRPTRDGSPAIMPGDIRT